MYTSRTRKRVVDLSYLELLFLALVEFVSRGVMEAVAVAREPSTTTLEKKKEGRKEIHIHHIEVGSDSVIK